MIQASLGRLWLMAFGALGFVLAGIWFWMRPEVFDSNTLFIRIVGAVAILFFGACFIFIAYRLIFRRPCLVLDEAGFRDDSSAVSAGDIPWTEVSGIRVWELKGQRILCIDVVTPEAVLYRQNKMKRLMMRLNMGLVGTPVTLAINTFPVSEAELQRLFQEYSGGRIKVFEENSK